MFLKTASLPPYVRAIILDKATESPFSGCYDDFDEAGTYLCRHCGWALYRASHKFHSGCGWPSFDEEVAKAVMRLPDRDGRRTEILCSRCEAHLGHVFIGENFTSLNTRHCVNSASLDFVPNLQIEDTEEAIVAAGCFWGVEHYFKQLAVVLKTEVGYTGGQLENPTYEAVCRGNTGHVEAVRIVYDPKQLQYERVLQYFFEIHDPTQHNGQGADVGEQYHSVIFAYNSEQRYAAQKLIQVLEKKAYRIATQIREVAPFYPAEDYHQAYYAKTGKEPYCHAYTQRF